MRKTKTVGARELKTRLGTYLRRVRAGETLIITDRGEPAAELRPIQHSGDSLESRLRQVEAEGLITRANGRPLPPFKPPRSKGTPASQTLIEAREDRF